MTVNHKPAPVVALERIGGRPHARLPALKELVEPRGDFTGVLRVLVLFELRAIHLLSQCHAKGRQQDAENCENSFGFPARAGEGALAVSTSASSAFFRDSASKDAGASLPKRAAMALFGSSTTFCFRGILGFVLPLEYLCCSSARSTCSARAGSRAATR